MTADTIGKAHDAFLRWQEVRIKHLGHVVNLVLTLSTATLGFEVNLVVERKIAPTSCFIASLTLVGFAIFMGLLTNWSRLQDFRYTAKAARGRELNARSLAGEMLDEEALRTASARLADREKARRYVPGVPSIFS